MSGCDTFSGRGGVGAVFRATALDCGGIDCQNIFCKPAAPPPLATRHPASERQTPPHVRAHATTHNAAPPRGMPAAGLQAPAHVGLIRRLRRLGCPSRSRTSHLARWPARATASSLRRTPGPTALCTPASSGSPPAVAFFSSRLPCTICPTRNSSSESQTKSQKRLGGRPRLLQHLPLRHLLSSTFVHQIVQVVLIHLLLQLQQLTTQLHG